MFASLTHVQYCDNANNMRHALGPHAGIFIAGCSVDAGAPGPMIHASMHSTSPHVLSLPTPKPLAPWSGCAGIFIADALSMPVHWYYDPRALQQDFGTITDFQVGSCGV